MTDTTTDLTDAEHEARVAAMVRDFDRRACDERRQRERRARAAGNAIVDQARRRATDRHQLIPIDEEESARDRCIATLHRHGVIRHFPMPSGQLASGVYEPPQRRPVRPPLARRVTTRLRRWWLGLTDGVL